MIQQIEFTQLSNIRAVFKRMLIFVSYFLHIQKIYFLKRFTFKNIDGSRTKTHNFCYLIKSLCNF